MTLVEQIMTRLRAGALVVIVQDSDEALARTAAEAVGKALPGGVRVMTGADPAFADALAAMPRGSGVLIGLDVLAIMGENPTALRMIRDVALQSREVPSRLILIETPAVKIPSLIAGDVDVIIPALPTVDELETELSGFVSNIERRETELPGSVPNIERPTPENAREVATAVTGMGRHEAARMFARSVVERGALDAAWLRAEKAEVVSIRSNRAITIMDPGDLDLGGMDALYEWIDIHKDHFSEKARAYGIAMPKGVLTVGVPGAGKSAMARVIARRWGIPLLYWDIGKMFGSLVGQSEAQTRSAFQIFRSCAPCVVLMDEIDKSLSVGSGGDGGTTSRVVGSILTEMQDKTYPAFFVATANDVTKLPAPLLRKGRFDEMFYVGLPDMAGRSAIAKIHLSKRSQAFGSFDEWPKKVAFATDGWTGAEIEQVILAGMHRGFAANRLTTLDDILTCAKATVPISQTMRAQIQEVKKWAMDNHVTMASRVVDRVSTPDKFRTINMLDGTL